MRFLAFLRHRSFLRYKLTIITWWLWELIGPGDGTWRTSGARLAEKRQNVIGSNLRARLSIC